IEPGKPARKVLDRRLKERVGSHQPIPLGVARLEMAVADLALRVPDMRGDGETVGYCTKHHYARNSQLLFESRLGKRPESIDAMSFPQVGVQLHPRWEPVGRVPNDLDGHVAERAARTVAVVFGNAPAESVAQVHRDMLLERDHDVE